MKNSDEVKAAIAADVEQQRTVIEQIQNGIIGAQATPELVKTMSWLQLSADIRVGATPEAVAALPGNVSLVRIGPGVTPETVLAIPEDKSAIINDSSSEEIAQILRIRKKDPAQYYDVIDIFKHALSEKLIQDLRIETIQTQDNLIANGKKIMQAHATAKGLLFVKLMEHYNNVQKSMLYQQMAAKQQQDHGPLTKENALARVETAFAKFKKRLATEQSSASEEQPTTSPRNTPK